MPLLMRALAGCSKRLELKAFCISKRTSKDVVSVIFVTFPKLMFATEFLSIGGGLSGQPGYGGLI